MDNDRIIRTDSPIITMVRCGSFNLVFLILHGFEPQRTLPINTPQKLDGRVCSGFSQFPIFSNPIKLAGTHRIRQGLEKNVHEFTVINCSAASDSGLRITIAPSSHNTPIAPSIPSRLISGNCDRVLSINTLRPTNC